MSSLLPKVMHQHGLLLAGMWYSWLSNPIFSHFIMWQSKQSISDEECWEVDLISISISSKLFLLMIFWQAAPHEAKQYHTYFVFWLKKEISEVQSELEIKILVANYALMSNVFLLRKILRGMYIFYDFISLVNSDILKAFSRRLNK